MGQDESGCSQHPGTRGSERSEDTGLSSTATEPRRQAGVPTYRGVSREAATSLNPESEK